MANEKAIEQLKIARCAFSTPEMRGAFEKAIEALKNFGRIWGKEWDIFGEEPIYLGRKSLARDILSRNFL